MNETTVVAIDPGKNGGIAYWSKGRAQAVKMPGTVKEMQNFLEYLKSTYGDFIVFIEKVNAYRGDHDDNPGKMFGINKMLENYAKMVAVITMMDLRFCEVYPITWQSTLGLVFRKQKLSKTERKNRNKEFAGLCFPEVQKMNLAIADALCILQFGLHKCGSDQLWIDDHIQNVPKNDLLS